MLGPCTPRTRGADAPAGGGTGLRLRLAANQTPAALDTTTMSTITSRALELSEPEEPALTAVGTVPGVDGGDAALGEFDAEAIVVIAGRDDTGATIVEAVFVALPVVVVATAGTVGARVIAAASSQGDNSSFCPVSVFMPERT